jgi:hypothetical protein
MVKELAAQGMTDTHEPHFLVLSASDLLHHLLT